MVRQNLKPSNYTAKIALNESHCLGLFDITNKFILYIVGISKIFIIILGCKDQPKSLIFVFGK